MSELPWHLVFLKMEAISAYDLGATDSGVKDEQLRKELLERVRAAPEDEVRVALSRWVSDHMLSQEALDQGYGWEDVLSFLDWFHNGGFQYGG